MATGFDDLVEQLLYDVALTGSKGLGADELERAVKAFYKSREQAKSTRQPVEEQDLLFSDASPASSIVVDEAFLDAVWNWLKKHPEIVIKSTKQPYGPASGSKHAGERIFTTEERTWQVIAGHGVDYSRLPRLLFECLSIIAAHGPNGVFQPALVQITGQDKRSVPGRTDLLAENDYIVKLPAYDGKTKTSLLKLRKFAEADGTSKPVSTQERSRTDSDAETLITQRGLNSNRTFGEIIQMLNDNDGIVAIVDLCTAYKLRKYTGVKKGFLEQLDRLVESGLFRKVTAQVESGNNRYVTCLQLVREPTEQDRDVFTGKLVDTLPSSSRPNGLLDGDDADNEELDSDGDLTDHNDEEVEETIDQGTTRVPPQWTPDIPPNNLIFNIVDKAGPAGISSMDLHKQAMGSFWKKSLDDLMLRLTDVWEISQPAHLRHLGIVRDTEVRGKNSHFHFRTLPNFEKAVEMELTAWEAVTTGNGKNKAGKPASFSQAPGLDQNGFPKLDPKLFADEEGRASLAECAKIVPKRGRPPKGPAELTPKKARAKKVKTPQTLSLPTTTTNTPQTVASSSDRTATGRRKRRDAGIPKGPRGPYKKRNSSLNTPTDEGASLQQVGDGPSTPADASWLAAASPAVGDKRPADAAQMNDSPQVRKTRKLTRTGLNDISQQGNDTRAVDVDDVPSRTTWPPSSDSVVTFNSPQAVKLRFEGWRRSGRKPNTKIATIKSDRLNDLQWFNPDGRSSEPQTEDAVPADEAETIETPDEELDTSTEPPASSDEPPQKKRRLNDGDAQGSAKEDNTADSASATPVLKKKRGRLRKNASIAQDPTQSSGATPKTFSNGGPDTANTDEHPSLVAKLPLRRSLLERFMQERSSSSVSTGEAIDNRSSSQATNKKSRVVTLPLPGAFHSDPIGNDADKDAITGGNESFTSFSDPSPAPTTSLTSSAKNSLVVKLPSKRSRTAANAASSMQRAPATIAAAKKTTTSPAFGLKIVRPYLASLSKGSEVQNDVSTSTNALNGASVSTDLPSESDGRSNEQSDIDTDPSPNGINGTEAAISSSRDDTDHTNGLSDLLPADADLDDGYRERENQKAGTARGGGFSHLHRKQIVMETMKKAGGVFPGDHEMWYPFTTAWQKKYPQIPDRRTVENTVNLHVKQGDLKKFSFKFADKNGKIVQRHILILPEIDPSSPKAKKVQQAMIDSYPFRYLPKEVTIAKHLRDRASQIPVTQGGSRRKDEDAPFTPVRWSTKRSNRGVSFDLRPRTTPIQTPEVEKSASFTPRSILKIKDTTQQPNIIDLEDDDFGSTSGAETTESESDHYDEALLEVSPEQAALQGSFGLNNYQHKNYKAPRERQGTRPLRKFRIGVDSPNTPSTPTGTPRPLVSAATPVQSAVQTFHLPTGTFGTIFAGKRKGGKPPKPPDTTALYFGATYAAPSGLADIRQKAVAVGHSPANSSDSRFFHFKNDVDGVMEWEKSIINDNRVMRPTNDTVFINHGLMQSHVVSEDADPEFNYEFVKGNLKPFDLENELRKTSEKPPASIWPVATAPTTTFSSYGSPYGDPFAGPFGLRSFTPFSNGTVANQASSSVRPYAHPSTLASIAPRSESQRLSRLSSVTSTPVAAEKSKGRYEYKTRNKETRRPSVKAADAAIPVFDRDSDDDYRPVRKVSATKIPTAKYVSPRERHAGPKKAKYQKFSAEDFKRLALAVALAKMICGGAGNVPSMNYDVVALALGPGHESDEARYQWQLPKKHGYDKAWATRVQSAMQEPFLVAYEKGELPKVDFEDLQSTEWPALLEWAEKVILPLIEGEALPGLPQDRNDVQIIMLDDSTGSGDEQVADGLGIKELVAPIRPRGHNKTKASSRLDQNYIMEKSWIRAVMTTDDGAYDENVAARKLGSIQPLTLEKATQEMLDTKTIKWKKIDRQQPSRSYEISPYTMSQFDRWSRSNGADYLKSLMEAREFLIAHFEQHDQLELAADVSEVHLSVLTNMVAQGQLRPAPILPERNDDFAAPWPKLSKWGQMNGTYDNESGKLPSLDIKVVYKRTPLFTSDHDLKLNVPIPTNVPMIDGEPDTRIPFWIDINGNIINSMWDEGVESILCLLVHAPGCTAKSIERAHDSKLWEWEIDMVLKWMETVGLATKDMSGLSGWSASEWWYCASSLMIETPEKETDGMMFGL